MKLDSVEEILDFAIKQEERAADFYTDLANRVEMEHTKDVFLSFAEEEKGHKAKLLEVKAGKQLEPAETKVANLKIGDYLEDVTLSTGLDCQDALILAMKAEKAAYRLYTNLASATDDPGLKQTLLQLALEEAKHKLKFEIEYDDIYLTEN